MAESHHADLASFRQQCYSLHSTRYGSALHHLLIPTLDVWRLCKIYVRKFATPDPPKVRNIGNRIFVTGYVRGLCENIVEDT